MSLKTKIRRGKKEGNEERQRERRKISREGEVNILKDTNLNCPLKGECNWFSYSSDINQASRTLVATDPSFKKSENTRPCVQSSILKSPRWLKRFNSASPCNTAKDDKGGGTTDTEPWEKMSF